MLSTDYSIGKVSSSSALYLVSTGFRLDIPVLSIRQLDLGNRGLNRTLL